MPVSGDASLGVWFSAAPPGAVGVLGLTPDAPNALLLGAALHVGAVVAVYTAAADAQGHAGVDLPVPGGIVGLTVYQQLNPPGCGQAGELSASDAVAVVVQP